MLNRFKGLKKRAKQGRSEKTTLRKKRTIKKKTKRWHFYLRKNDRKPTFNQRNYGIWCKKVQKTALQRKNGLKKKPKKGRNKGEWKISPLNKNETPQKKKIRSIPFLLTQKRVPLNRICLLRNVKITLTILKNKGYGKIIVADKRKTDYRWFYAKSPPFELFFG